MSCFFIIFAQLFLFIFSIETTLPAKEFVLSEGTKKLYETGVEKERLNKGNGKLEKARTEKLLDQFLPKPPAIILDVGGGMGVYSFGLAKKGYTVYLIDPVPVHIEEAKKIGQNVTGHSLKDYIVGDARKIEMADQSVDVVLFFGPLYHLDRSDRQIALAEAFRVLKRGGKFFAAGISKQAPLLSFFKKERMTADSERAIVDSLSKGRFEYRGGIFFSHNPDELKEELVEAGFQAVSVRPIEGCGYFLSDEYVENEKNIATVLSIIELTEKEPSSLGISSHLMAIGEKLID